MEIDCAILQCTLQVLFLTAVLNYLKYHNYTGLGSKKLSFSQSDDSDDVHYYILEAFPQLKDAGGYELLRAWNGRLLEVLPSPPHGYSVAYLRDVAQQAKIYIRPIQKNLMVEIAASSSVSHTYNFICIYMYVKIPLSS